MPSTKPNTVPVQKFRSRKVVRSTIGCFAVNMRTKNATALTAEMTIAVVTGPLSNQSLDGPSSSAYSSAPRKPAIVTRPK